MSDHQIEKVLVVFLDGVGLGNDTPGVNPFSDHPLPFLNQLLDQQKLIKANAGYSNERATLLGLDARLGVAGLPQSGTGQTAILTGLNAPAHLGEHDGPYPNQVLKALLGNQNLFKDLQSMGKPVAYAGAYPEKFHRRLQRGKARLSANTRAAFSAGLQIRGYEELKAGQAISGMLTNKYWQEWGLDVSLLTPEEAGAQLVHLAQDYALTYFEFWQTDFVGHKQNTDQAAQILTLLDAFFAGIVQAADLETTLVMIISDHGNFEDLSTKHHTLNPALTILIGGGHQQVAANLHALTDITPTLLSLFK